jgi:hypothetical protein
VTAAPLDKRDLARSERLTFADFRRRAVDDSLSRGMVHENNEVALRGHGGSA